MMGRIVLLIAVMATAILSLGLTFFAAESIAAAETTHATNFANAGLASRNIGPTPASRTRTVGTPSQSDPVLVGAGDIASCSSSGDEATAALLDGIPGTVFTTGDNAYESGTASEFSDCYGPPPGDATRRAPCPPWATTSTRRLAPRVTSATSAPPGAPR